MKVTLPDEVLYQIFGQLDACSLGSVLQCNTTFYRIATSSALWELPYLLRWSTGHPDRESSRGTDVWRHHHKLRRLEHHARRASEEQGLPSESPFRYLKLASQQNAAIGSTLSLDFYRLFLERITIDQEVLDTVYQQVEAIRGRIPVVSELALRWGNDAKDVLTSVVDAQLSCPSSSANGRPYQSAPISGAKYSKNRNLLAHSSTTYRVSAYQAHLPTTLRSETHHLVILHHAREILEHLQRREAMQRINDLSSLPTSMPNAGHFVSSQTETAVSLLTMFRGGEAKFVESQLDVLAAACDLYLQTRFPEPNSSHSALSTLEKAKEMAMAICDFLADHGFRGARDDLFSDLDNHFLHYCFATNRETLPLSLTLIFCGVANRLGLNASLCNFPMRILAFVSADPAAPLPGPSDTLDSASRELFWLDVTEYTTVAYDSHEPTPEDIFARKASWLQQRPPILDREDITNWIERMGVPPNDDFWRPAEADSMVQRAARNILSSVQRAQINPRTNNPVGQARSAIRNMEVTRRSGRLEQHWRTLARVDYAFLSSFYGRTDADEHIFLSSHVAAALDQSSVHIAEDETTWNVVKAWRSQSMQTLTHAPETWALPAHHPSAQFRQFMLIRSQDNDWTNTIAHLHNRADTWSEHDQQAAKYAAVNAFLRLSAGVNAREVDWIAGFLQSYFMLDVAVIEQDFLGHVQGEESANEVDSDAESESSGEDGGFSIHAARNATPSRQATQGIVTNPSARIILGRMLQAVRAKDAEAPRVNYRSGNEARRQRKLRTAGQDSDTNRAELYEANDREEMDMVGFRVGTIFRHRTYRYVGGILGWDPYCAAPEDWIVNMGVDRLPPPPNPSSTSSSSSSSTSTSPADSSPDVKPSSKPRRGGRHQPFYHSQVSDGTRRYVAEVNVEPIPGPIWIYGIPHPEAKQDERGEVVIEEGRVLGKAIHKMLQLRGLGEYFRCFDQKTGRLRRNRDARCMFPDDWSDDEDGYEQDRVDDEVGQEDVEILSEDGSW
ncbi:uncharacterized protein MEPE_01399 [Melanopsichium pennsylvanicum]|uniref:F-box domain-containing protein n=2 Tax=Melanopsichium pennsylvanicum TaxID=63383 RepID=A0AAJ5C3M5_9BASI|nr:f-box domain-containing protein [Melanopsichium pennsylvanicum 4]SNX82693.1 uncharacterized protein MEPE_01399 [Melanopsichium pennsylvanicum]